jgi:hypothetical protein
MIELHITMSGRSYRPDADHHIFGYDRKRFPDMHAAKAWLRQRYGTCKRQPMYRDRDNGPPLHCGYVYHFNGADWSHSPVEKWRQQDWVEFRESKPADLAAQPRTVAHE